MRLGTPYVRKQALYILLPIIMLSVLACSPSIQEQPRVSADTSPPSGISIVVGDIDPDEPAKKIERFQPLADYLAKNLEEFGVTDSRVVIARDIEHMASLIEEGKVDIYMDSAFPILSVQELTPSDVILRRWKREDHSYWSVFIARKDSDIESAEDFEGKVIAFEEPHSTSGYVLPGGSLIKQGLSITEVDSPFASVSPNEIGYFFSRDEENTTELVLQGQVAGGAVSNQDYAELPPEFKDEIISFDPTISVPRQLVLVRQGLDAEMVEKLKTLFEGLNESDEGREILEIIKKTSKFDPLPEESATALDELKELMRLVSEN